ncbi:hypothetical protein JHK82_023533 [Glycine max]|uniref:Uncharacterized protein n=2 Tax=Glycine subgen. Soja TaxID=1462606 RepID=A0A0R0J185_SOYBN|nr:hypothetical protein JHK87_023482 [Glycine soja]KAG5017909.1 hypothetical protein JHK85_024045 [Glycine max]KAG5027679.1 hypothetical protein JHK86_023593 [Glycine max]KAG5138802.1 hypothetical protein JHK82_023533 [Glycine max]KAH1054787.1 hypothetical protein GYH30_023519 [Glycine max]
MSICSCLRQGSLVMCSSPRRSIFTLLMLWGSELDKHKPSCILHRILMPRLGSAGALALMVL